MNELLIHSSHGWVISSSSIHASHTIWATHRFSTWRPSDSIQDSKSKNIVLDSGMFCSSSSFYICLVPYGLHVTWTSFRLVYFSQSTIKHTTNMVLVSFVTSPAFTTASILQAVVILTCFSRSICLIKMVVETLLTLKELMTSTAFVYFSSVMAGCTDNFTIGTTFHTSVLIRVIVRF